MAARKYVLMVEEVIYGPFNDPWAGELFAKAQFEHTRRWRLVPLWNPEEA